MGRKTNSNLDGGKEIHEVRVCNSDAHREIRYVCLRERLHNSSTYHSSDRGRASLEHKSISTLYRGQRYNIDSTL